MDCGIKVSAIPLEVQAVIDDSITFKTTRGSILELVYQSNKRSSRRPFSKPLIKSSLQISKYPIIACRRCKMSTSLLKRHSKKMTSKQPPLEHSRLEVECITASSSGASLASGQSRPTVGSFFVDPWFGVCGLV